MNKQILATLLLLLYTFAPTFSQNLSHGFLPTVNVNIPVSESWRINTKLESRFVDAFSHALTDVALVASRKVGVNDKIGFGAMTRMRNARNAQRLIQQYTIVRRYPAFRLSHRFAADETWTKSEPLEIRLRYRFTAQIPLNGQSVNPREMYLKIGNEYLGSLENDRTDIEIRITPTLGYEFSDQNKIEAGIDYRLGDLLSAPARHQIWYSINWFYTLDRVRTRMRGK